MYSAVVVYSLTKDGQPMPNGMNPEMFGDEDTYTDFLTDAIGHAEDTLYGELGDIDPIYVGEEADYDLQVGDKHWLTRYKFSGASAGIENENDLPVVQIPSFEQQANGSTFKLTFEPVVIKRALQGGRRRRGRGRRVTQRRRRVSQRKLKSRRARKSSRRH